jgi:hypothetical protein
MRDGESLGDMLRGVYVCVCVWGGDKDNGGVNKRSKIMEWKGQRAKSMIDRLSAILVYVDPI